MKTKVQFRNISNRKKFINLFLILSQILVLILKIQKKLRKKFNQKDKIVKKSESKWIIVLILRSLVLAQMQRLHVFLHMLTTTKELQ